MGKRWRNNSSFDPGKHQWRLVVEVYNCAEVLFGCQDLEKKWENKGTKWGVVWRDTCHSQEATPETAKKENKKLSSAQREALLTWEQQLGPKSKKTSTGGRVRSADGGWLLRSKRDASRPREMKSVWKTEHSGKEVWKRGLVSIWKDRQNSDSREVL